MANKLSVPSVRNTPEQQQEIFAAAADPLVSLKTAEVEGATLSELAEIIKAAHSSFKIHLGSALQAALIAGRALLEAKEQFSYNRQIGGFRGWLAEIDLSRSSAYRYIDLARHDQIVSQAGTLSEAMTLLSQYRSEQRALKSSTKDTELKKRRITLTLTSNRDSQLENIANERGVELSVLMGEILDQWLTNQD